MKFQGIKIGIGKLRSVFFFFCKRDQESDKWNRRRIAGLHLLILLSDLLIGYMSLALRNQAFRSEEQEQYKQSEHKHVSFI